MKHCFECIVSSNLAHGQIACFHILNVFCNSDLSLSAHSTASCHSPALVPMLLFYQSHSFSIKQLNFVLYYLSLLSQQSLIFDILLGIFSIICFLINFSSHLCKYLGQFFFFFYTILYHNKLKLAHLVTFQHYIVINLQIQ